MMTRLAPLLLVLATGCAGDGKSPDPKIETAPFAPLVCTADSPSSPTCPFNEISLADLGAAGKFRFVIGATGANLRFDRATFDAGAEGLYIEAPVLLTWAAGATVGTPTTAFGEGAVFNIPPNTSQIAVESPTITGDASMRISLQFGLLEAYRL